MHSKINNLRINMQNMKNHITWWWWRIELMVQKDKPKNALDKSKHGLIDIECKKTSSRMD
jgi:hypothetical protein